MPQRAPAALGTVIAGLLAVGIVAAVTKTGDRGPAHPDEWDPRVIELVTYLEGARGLDFDHPVYVDFLTPAEYTEAATSDAGGLGAENRTELDRYAGELRAIGVATGEIDLFAAYNQVSDGGTLAFYDPAVQRVKVRGVTMTVSLEVTLVHELTHALQDQHFDLGRLESGEMEAGAATALRGLVEGDAVRIEDDYIREVLTPEEQTTYDEQYAAELEASEAATGDVPAFVSASVGAPYLLGQPLAVMLANRGGNDAVDRGFRNPPKTEEHLFDPASYLAEEGSQDVGLDLAKADHSHVFDDGSFGSPAWYLMLVERIDPKVAFDAVLGWDGDAYAAFERDDRTCMRAAFAGDSADDEAEMDAALTQWVAAMPGGEASAIEIDGHPGLEACDPGPDVDMQLTGRAERALFVPSLWGYLVADAATRLEADGARCYARGVLKGLTFEQITDVEGTAFQGEDFQHTMIQAFQACTQASDSSALQSRSGDR
jgi:hypothetical protein